MLMTDDNDNDGVSLCELDSSSVRQPFSNLFPHLTVVGDDGWAKGIEAAAALSGGSGGGWVDGATCRARRTASETY